MKATDLIAAMAARRSVRFYLPMPLEPELVLRLIGAACWAPSAHNRQPWRFCIVETEADKACLADAMGARLRVDRMRDGDTQGDIDADVARSYARITRAPVVIAACTTLADMDRYCDARRADAERAMAMQSTAMACQNLLLAAHAEGLGACWMCGPLFCPDVVANALNLPADWEPQALVTLGWPAAPGKPRPRRAPEYFIQRGRLVPRGEQSC
jgi:coenzyme F420-0:L-glutamate ligase / coenzyme F420-1:gamma-L-glutamate ligase